MMFSQLLKILKNAKGVKMLAALALAGAVALSASACNFSLGNTTGNDPSTTITDPSGDTNTTDPSDTTTTDPGDSSSSGSGDTDTTEEHSEIYNTVKNSTYYANLVMSNMVNTTEGTLYYYPNNAKCQSLAPIPYGFLESQGCDVSSIKSGDWSCLSYPYFMGDDTNAIYIALNAQTTSSPYYTCYVLKYKLTDLEYSDFMDLCSSRVVERNLFVQELSNQKTPTIESQACMLISTYDRILNYISDGTTNSTAIYTSNELFGTTSLAMSVLGFSAEDDLLQLAVMTDGEIASDVKGGQISGQIRYANVRSGAYYQELGDTPISSTTYDGVEVCNFAYKSVIFKTDDDAESWANYYDSITCCAQGTGLYGRIGSLFKDTYKEISTVELNK